MDRASDDETRERLEEALKESEERFERLVEAAKDYAIFMTDADGRVSTWNEGAERLFGYGEMETARTEGRAEDERWHVRKDGSRFWASGFVRPVRDEGGELLGFSKVARDLTEFKRAEEAVEEAREAERERIARDLHDLVLQDLVSALQAAEAHRLARRGDEREAAEEVREMIYSLRRASQGVREAVHELRAGEAVGRALARAVEDLVGVERRRSPRVEVELEVSEGGSLGSFPRRCAGTSFSW
jgi:signal transduction histidine kinase